MQPIEEIDKGEARFIEECELALAALANAEVHLKGCRRLASSPIVLDEVDRILSEVGDAREYFRDCIQSKF